MEAIGIIKKIGSVLWDIVVQLALGREGYQAYRIAERHKRQLKINRQYNDLMILEAEAEIRERRLSIREREGSLKLKIARDRVKAKNLRGNSILDKILSSGSKQRR